jgi:sulfoxide reductase heme-binding subunit YedZ
MRLFERPSQTLTNNSRFYILVSSVLLSVAVVCGARLTIPSDQLFLIRSQQIYGLIAVILLYLATILTPLSKLWHDKKIMPLLLFSRRAIGVSAAYFAILHTIIVLVYQADGWSGLSLLPTRFKVAFILGGGALLILTLMALTSFDKAIAWMTFPRWKKLHRFVYPAGVLVIVHVWLIGTHAAYFGVRVAGLVPLALLFGLESVRIARTYAAQYKLDADARLAIGVLAFGLMLGSLALLPLLTPNYHSQHAGVHESHDL